MIRTAVLQIRVDPGLRDRLARLRDERHINVSAWLRDLVETALDREFLPDGEMQSAQPKPPARSHSASGENHLYEHPIEREKRHLRVSGG